MVVMASSQQFCLRWNNHQRTLISVFDHLLESGTLVDCTLAAEGQFLKAHKVVLSACSPYLEAILSQHYEKHPILILKDVSFNELKSMLDYMYRGEVNISQEQLGTFLKAAESLQIKGLTDNGTMNDTKDLDRSRDIEHSQIDRQQGIFPKRTDIRKQIFIPRPRSPLISLPPNLMINADHKKSNKHSLVQEVNSGFTNINCNREGGISPIIKKKRPNPQYFSQIEDQNVGPTSMEDICENNNGSVKLSKESSPAAQNSSNCTSLSSVPEVTLKKQGESEVVESVVEKNEVKSENVDFSDDVHNDDSVEDLTVDEEEEEMDELDLSKPGPSNVSNSHVAGIPWHTAREGNGEDLLLASQQDSQDAGRALLECVKCHKTYSSPHTLRRHVRLECGQEPRFMCPYCPHRTKQRYNLMLHIGRTHREVLTQAAVSLDK